MIEIIKKEDIIVKKSFFDNNSVNGKFGSNRPNGRKHAGVDIRAVDKAKVFCPTLSKVLKIDAFYKGTQEVVLLHEYPRLLGRYCEILPSSNLRVGDKLKMGDVIGTVQEFTLNNEYLSMLHFELYRAKFLINTKGLINLTDKTNSPYFRNNELIDPTEFMSSHVNVDLLEEYFKYQKYPFLHHFN